MKLYGSLQNRMMESARQRKPEIGMGATITSYTDRHAATIVRMTPSGKTVWVQRDKVTRTDRNGMSEDQSYSFERAPEAQELRFRLYKSGWRGYGGSGLVIGHRDHYHDFSF